MDDKAGYINCGDNGPNGLSCTRPEGHDGDHSAMSFGIEWEKADE